MIQQVPISGLIVDDEEENYVLFESALSSIEAPQYFVYWAPDRESAADVLANEKIDVCLVNHAVDSGGGLAFIRQSIEDGHTVPMLVLSATPDHEIDVAASEAGAWGFLPKADLQPETIERTIRFVLQRSQQATDLDLTRIFMEVIEDDVGNGILVVNGRNEIECWNLPVLEMLGLPLHLSREQTTDRLRQALLRIEAAVAVESQFESDAGRTINVQYKLDGAGRTVLILDDQTDRSRASEDDSDSHQRLVTASRAKSRLLEVWANHQEALLNACDETGEIDIATEIGKMIAAVRKLSWTGENEIEPFSEHLCLNDLVENAARKVPGIVLPVPLSDAIIHVDVNADTVRFAVRKLLELAVTRSIRPESVEVTLDIDSGHETELAIRVPREQFSTAGHVPSHFQSWQYALIRHIAEVHGGELHVTSGPSIGLVTEFVLPPWRTIAQHPLAGLERASNLGS